MARAHFNGWTSSISGHRDLVSHAHIRDNTEDGDSGTWELDTKEINLKMEILALRVKVKVVEAAES